MTHRRSILVLAIVFMVAILAGYYYVYQYSPFSDKWNSFLIEMADPFTALLGAVAMTGVLLCYRQEDKPYPVWLFFTIGMWAWVLAESTWSYIDFTTGASPALGLPDVVWFIGYFSMSLALRNQFQLVYQTKIEWWKLLAIWAGLLLAVVVVLFIVQSPITTQSFVDYFYPVVDFALCIASIRLFMAFGGGHLARPWIGLFVLGISDAVWAWMNASGQYQVSADAGTWLSTFTDTTYVAAYLILAFGFLMQYLLLRYGPDGASVMQ
jgi:hypothetical protein